VRLDRLTLLPTGIGEGGHHAVLQALVVLSEVGPQLVDGAEERGVDFTAIEVRVIGVATGARVTLTP
jgi:hypothetical protein